MEFRVLAVGDVVSQAGVRFVCKHLRNVKRQYGVDFCVVNGENASNLGITPEQAEDLFTAGADVITLGNHTWSRREIVPYLDDCRYMLRPANFAPQVPGRGWGVYDTKIGPVAVVDLIGRVAMDYTPDNPFLQVDRILKQLDAKLILVELHAEATSEKLAMGHMLDGRVAAVWGTHTHVPTADAQILPNGSGYVTDLGMCGPANSVLGIQPELSIRRFRGDLPCRYEPAGGVCKMESVLFTFGTSSGRCIKAERVDVHG